MRTALLLGLLALTVAAGCAAPSSFIGYLENRRQDLIDVAHLDFSVVNAGAVSYIGPFIVGMDWVGGLKTGNPSSQLQIGLGGPRILDKSGVAAGWILAATYWDDDKKIMGRRPKRTPSGFSIGGAIGAFVGVLGEFDMIELVDFVAGIACLDPMHDDECLAPSVAPPPPPPPPTPPVTPTTPTPSGPLFTGNEIYLSLQPDGSIVVDGKTVPLDELRAQLAEVGRKNPQIPVRILIRRATTYDQTTRARDMCSAAKLTNVSVVTVPDP